MRSTTLLVSSLAVLLQACAINPLVRWDPPSTPANAEAMALDHGKRYSEAARRAYQRKIDEQVGTATNLSSGLIGLGALVTALAVSSANKDVVIGAALLGGTAYALGNWNLDRRRLVIYQAAVAGFNCADRAVQPLNMSQADLVFLGSDLRALDVALIDARTAMAVAQRELDQWRASQSAAVDAAGFDADLAVARSMTEAAGRAQANGRGLYAAAGHAGDRLIDAVRKIDQEADAALMDTAGDLSKVPQVIAGLAGLAGIFSAASEQSLSSAGTKLGSAGVFKAESGGSGAPPSVRVVPPSSLINARASMLEAVGKVAVLAQSINARVVVAGKAVQSDGLADCGVGAINLGLALSPASLEVVPKKAGTTTVAIGGGKPPFEVRLNGAPVAGLTHSGPVRLQRNFMVQTTTDLKPGQTANFLVLDSSDPERSVPFVVTSAGVAEGTGSTDANETAGTPESQGRTGALMGLRPFLVNGVTLSPAGQPRQMSDGKTLEVPLGCKPSNAPRLTQSAVRAAYLAQARTQGLVIYSPQALVFAGQPVACIAR